MAISLQISPERFLLLLGLSFFFGLAFEEFYGAQPVKPPGGVRTFPLLAFQGAGLFLLEPSPALPFTAGLLVLGAWLVFYYRSQIKQSASPGERSGEAVIPVANILAYVLGPLVLVAPIWVSIGFTVAAVLLLGEEQRLHTLARKIAPYEIATLGKFLILTGIVLPLLPNEPVTTLTRITPYQVWLAVVAVSTLSYASYLAQRYGAPRRGSLLASLLGGLYSSTVTTVVLARRLRGETGPTGVLQGGIVLATAIMYVRLIVVVGVFDFALARALLPALLPLCLLALAFAGLSVWHHGRAALEPDAAPPPSNPLELSTAFLFAVLFVVISLASTWTQGALGQTGLYWLAAVVGVTDIDPFVLSIAEGSVKDASLPTMTIAIVIAASSNNLLKAVYAIGFARWRGGALPAAILILLAVLGFALAGWLARGAA